MRVVYRVLAYLIALAVVLQAASIALAFFGLGAWIEGGGVLDKSAIESSSTHFQGEGGLAYHGTAGMMIIPALGLLLLIASFFTRSRGAIGWAGIVFGCIVVQVALGMFAHAAYLLGAVHGLFAFAVLATAGVAARRIARADVGEPAAQRAATTPAAPTVDVG
jgi:hypothetical protein